MGKRRVILTCLALIVGLAALTGSGWRESPALADPGKPADPGKSAGPGKLVGLVKWADFEGVRTVASRRKVWVQLDYNF